MSGLTKALERTTDNASIGNPMFFVFRPSAFTVSGIPRISMNSQISSFKLLEKGELYALCDLLLMGDAVAIEQSIAFIEAETFGIWHGRARAMMARRLKHCQLSQSQRTRVVRAILDRFVSGRFSEQFKDQLRLVLHFTPEKAFTVAHSCQGAGVEHVRRYATWILLHE